MNVNVPPGSIPNTAQPMEWPEGALTRIPFWIYQSPEITALEQQRLFEGPVWNFLCLEAEVAKPGDYRVTFVGSMPVIVARDFDDEIYAFENRCAHRGALIALDQGGHARDFTCVYHAWNYDLKGNLKAVAFEDGVNGQGGMDKTFCRVRPRAAEAPHRQFLRAGVRLASATTCRRSRSISATRSRPRSSACCTSRSTVTGRFTQMLPNNWKLYFENVKDTYHASLLHTFFTTFRINRLSQRGGMAVSPNGGSHVSYSFIDKANQENDYAAMGIRSDIEDFALKDPSLLDNADEFGDGCHMQILSVFPNLVLQQIQNALAVRQVLPKGQMQTALNWTTFGFVDDTPEMKTRRLRQNNLAGPAGYVSMEDGAVGGFVQRGVAAAGGERAVVEMGGSGTATQNTRATEASVRGFWKCYRAHMGV